MPASSYARPGLDEHWSSDPARVAGVVQQVVVTRQLEELLRAFNQAGIDTILLKGTAFWNWLYEPGERPVSDIDIMVRQGDFDRACKVVQEAGYRHKGESTGRRATERASHNCGFFPPRIKEKQVFLEVHRRFTHASRYDIDAEGLFQRSVQCKVGEQGTSRLSPEDNLLHLAIHKSVHNGGFDTDMRNLEDAHRIIQVSDVDWQVLVERAEGWGCSLVLWILLDSIRRVFGSAVPGWVMDRTRPDVLRMAYLSLFFQRHDGAWVFSPGKAGSWTRRFGVFPVQLDRMNQVGRSLVAYAKVRLLDLWLAMG